MRYALATPVGDSLISTVLSSRQSLFVLSCLLCSGLPTFGAVADEVAPGADGLAPRPESFAALDSNAEAIDVALWTAAAEGDVERLDFLIANGADPESTVAALPTSALWIAAQEGHTEIVRRLLALGSGIETKDPSDGRTALFQAAQEGHAETVALLLAHGASVDVASARTGATPLFMAAAGGHADVVRLLLAAKSNVHVFAAANGVVDSPLSIARKRGYADVVDLIGRADGISAAHQSDPE